MECIPKDQYCDGVKNCVNGEDEKNCPKPENLERIENKFGPDRRWNAIWSKYLFEKNSLVHLNKYKTDPCILQIFQSNTSVCLIISVFCKSC